MESTKKTVSMSDVANVKEAINLNNVVKCAILEAWSAETGSISAAHTEVLEEARQDLLLNRNMWNEEELKMNFISAVLRASRLDMPNKIKVFFERPLTGSIGDYTFSVVCDCMVATPTSGGRPQAPYFFLQEFKKGKGDKYDPEAQMLVAMLLAQQKNNDNAPVYGAWVQGEIWYFSVLLGADYCVSDPYVAHKVSDLHRIVFMLQSLKTRILNR